MRTALVFMIGALVGAAVTILLATTGRMIQGPAVSSPVIEPAARGDAGFEHAPPPARAPAIAKRLEIYRLAAGAGASELERRIEVAAAEPGTRTRQFTLEVLLTRLAEIDAARAVRLGRELELGTDMLTPLYAVLAETDLSAALEALAALDDARAAESAGLAVLDAARYDERALERVLAVLAADPDEFRVTVLGALAASDPRAAFERAAALPSTQLRSRALRRVTRAWARSDPRAALAQAETIPERDLRSALGNLMLRAWADREPVAALRHAARRGEGMQALGPMVPTLMTGLGAADPRDLLEAAAELDGNMARMAEQVGLSGLAARDPEAALRYVERLPDSERRRQLTASVATAYGRADPDAALAWARDLQPPMPQVEASVLGGIAQADLPQALELALEHPRLERAQALQQVVANAMNASAADYGRLANTLLAQPSAAARGRHLQMLASRWSRSDPEAALRWLVDHGDEVSAQLFESAASLLAQQDPELAARYVARVPDDARPSWLRAVASGYVRNDPERAVGWIEQFRGDPAYAAGAAAVARGLAAVDPPAAARLLDGLDAEPARGPAFVVARQWAGRDPYAAGQWAAGIAEPELRTLAVSGVARTWVRRDAQSAQGWVLGLPSGAARDGALGAMVSALASTQLPSARLLDAFSSDSARQQHLLGTVSAVAQRDEAEARALIDAQFTDPAMRRQAEQVLESSVRVRAGSTGQRAFGPGAPAPFEAIEVQP